MIRQFPKPLTRHFSMTESMLCDWLHTNAAARHNTYGSARDIWPPFRETPLSRGPGAGGPEVSITMHVLQTHQCSGCVRRKCCCAATVSRSAMKGVDLFYGRGLQRHSLITGATTERSTSFRSVSG